MQWLRWVLAHGWLGLLAGLLLAPAAVTGNELSQTPAATAYQLLANAGMEAYDPPYADYEGVPCQSATGWQRFWYGGAAPCWMDNYVYAYSHLGTGWQERIEGDTSQMVFSTEPYFAGLFQQVGGLTPGAGYGFHAAMLTIFQTSAQPPEHGTMIKQVGLDPTGGTDPQSPAVVWSEPDGWDQGPWRVDLRAATFAAGPVVTVFIRVESPLPGGAQAHRNLSFFDSALLARTPDVAAESPATSDETSFVVSWDNAVPAPGLRRLRGCDVEWLDEAEGTWHRWFTETDEVQAVFSGERNHAYRFRARLWQRYENGALLAGPFRTEGDSRTWVRGPVLAGRVMTHDERPVSGATVGLAGTPYSTTTDPHGGYELLPPPLPGPQTLAVAHDVWPVPPPVYGVSFGPLDTRAYTFTLPAPKDAVTNGGFEAGLAGWQPAGQAPAVTADPVHTGYGALALSGTGGASFSTGVTQSVTIANAWDPALSLWYNPAVTGPGSRFSVRLTVSPPPAVAAGGPPAATHVLTPALDATGWRHLFYTLGPPDTPLTATVTIALRVWHVAPASSAIYVDEVSLGATLGGPFKIYLPLAEKYSLP